jgi:hypothetical protein
VTRYLPPRPVLTRSWRGGSATRCHRRRGDGAGGHGTGGDRAGRSHHPHHGGDALKTVVDDLKGPRGVDALGHGRTLVTDGLDGAGTQVPAEAVATSVTVGRDGSWYIGGTPYVVGPVFDPNLPTGSLYEIH